MHSQADERQAEQYGRALRQARKHAGFTLKKLAEAADVHLNTVSDIERGKVVAKRETLDKIAQTLGRPLDEIVGVQPIEQPGEQATVSFLEDFRQRNPHLFEEWSGEMWQRYLELCCRDEVFNDGPARLVAGRVKKEFRYIEQLRYLLDIDEEANVVAALVRECARCQMNGASAGDRNARVDSPHDLSRAHHAASLSVV